MPGRAPGESESDDQAGARRANRAVTRVWKGKWRRFAPRFSEHAELVPAVRASEHLAAYDVAEVAVHLGLGMVSRSAVQTGATSLSRLW